MQVIPTLGIIWVIIILNHGYAKMLSSTLKHSTRKAPYKRSLATLFISAISILGLVSAFEVSAKTTSSAPSNCGSQSAFTPCFYVAGGLVLSKVAPDGEVGGWSASKTSSSGLNLVVGHHFKPQIFGELSYTDLGKATLKNNASTISGTENIKYKVASLHAGYLVKEPNEAINFYVKGGLSSIQNNASSSRIPYKKQSSILPSFGAGAQWQSPDSGLFARFGADYFSSDAYAVNLSVGYKFDLLKKKSTAKHPAPRKRVKPKPRIIVKRRAVRKAPARRVVKKRRPSLRIISSIVQQPSFAGVLNGVDFKPNTAILSERAKSVLKSIARKLKNKPNMRVTLIGHTDSLGITAEKMLLSKSRAASAKAFLIRQGVSSRRMISEGRGDSQPRATNSTAGGRRVNNRIELRAL